jgi:hypothetical protein
LHDSDKRYHYHYVRPQRRALLTHFFSTLPFRTKSPFLPLQITTNQPRPRPKAFPRARTHLSLLAYHSGPRIRAHSIPSPIKPATASPTSAPGVNSQRLPPQPRLIRRSTTNRNPQTRAVLSRCTPTGGTRLKPYRASRISASVWGLFMFGYVYGYFARASACRAWNLFVRAVGGSGGRG